MFDKVTFSKILSDINDSYDTMTEFANHSEVNRTYLSQYINQKLDSPPSPKVLMKIANNSHNIATYEQLMDICGYLVNDVNKGIDKVKNDEKVLEYENLIKKLNLSEKENSIVNKINSLFDTLNKKYSIEDSQQKSLQLLDSFDTVNCDINKIREAADMYIISKCAKTVINRIYKNAAEIDTNYNYIDSLNKLDVLSKDIQIPTNSSFYMMAVYGQISAGTPNWAEECIEGRIPIDPELFDIVNPEEHFFLRVKGESMNKVIRNGAYALIHKQDIVENGEIAVVLVNGYEATLKHFSKQGDIVVLTPDSDDSSFQQQIYTKETPIKILGKYIGKFEMN